MSTFLNLNASVRTALLTLTWFPVIYTFTNHVYQPCVITGASMSPTFNPGLETTSDDIALIQKFNLKKTDSFQKGDVVMFRSPTEPEKLVTKRIVGLQGELVYPKSPPYPKQQTIIPRNHLWVEGDNMFHSIDSNTFGPISQALVVGKVIGILWPLSRISSSIESGGRDATKQKDIEVKMIDDVTQA